MSPDGVWWTTLRGGSYTLEGQIDKSLIWRALPFDSALRASLRTRAMLAYLP